MFACQGGQTHDYLQSACVNHYATEDVKFSVSLAEALQLEIDKLHIWEPNPMCLW